MKGRRARERVRGKYGIKEGEPGIGAMEAGGFCSGLLVRSSSVGNLISIPASDVTIIREEEEEGRDLAAHRD